MCAYARENRIIQRLQNAALAELFEFFIPTGFLDEMRELVVEQHTDDESGFSGGRHLAVAQHRDGYFIGRQGEKILKPFFDLFAGLPSGTGPASLCPTRDGV